ncbi:hypothetical protein [Vallitalea maricola]|uniref:Uncharacterized protein n=1 Tax=Vallitalea maricola TaxID=3074433 RepID=A0ACB5UKM1_9FIRM|nr:hypothetical protein AN2V17_27560 [Vallitalea sp. AN17-2]
MNPRIINYSNRIKAIIQESKEVLATKQGSTIGGSFIGDKIKLNAWLTKARNIIKITFGEHSIHYVELDKKLNVGVSRPSDVDAITGVLMGALDDLENGYIVGQEFLIAGEIFDSVLEEAKHLLETSHKDASAVLGRVVVEDALKRIARREGIDDTYKTSRINDELKKIQIYTQPQWRLIQAWLDIGNSAAHGNFSNYDNNDVKNMLSGIEQFLAHIN